MPCQVILNNPSSTYFPGSTIEGKLVCTFNREIHVRGIKVRLRGNEETRWLKTSNNKRPVYYSGSNMFLKSQVNFVGEGSVGPGTLEYPFQFVLPKNCPGSFKTRHGVIWYYLEGLVDTPWESRDDNHFIFTVVAPIDFNDPMLDAVMFPCDFQGEKILCCCSCSRGAVELNVHLDKTAFVLGEIVNVRVQISNVSNVNVKSLSAKLIMVINEKATFPKKSSKASLDLITYAHETGVGAHGKRSYNLILQIPPNFVIPNFSMCTLFQKWCILKVRAEFSGCHTALEVPIRVTLGHVSQISQHSETVFVDAYNYVQSTRPADPLPSSFPLVDNIDMLTLSVNGAYLPEVHRPVRTEHSREFGSRLSGNDICLMDLHSEGIIPTISSITADQEWEEIDDRLIRPVDARVALNGHVNRHDGYRVTASPHWFAEFYIEYPQKLNV